MNNLASLKSQLLYDYSEGDQNLWRSQNFYGHHNMPPRSHLKSSEGKFKPNAKNIVHIIPALPESRQFQNIGTKTVGRNLFNNAQKAQIPGPGYYEQPLRKYSSHCYIKRQEEHILNRISRKIQKRELIIQSRGPGLYNPETAFNKTSKSKSITQAKIFNGTLVRQIVPRQKMDNLFLMSALAGKVPNTASSAPDSTQMMFNTSNFKQSTSHKISITQRSNIAKEDAIPGPGFYQWDKCLYAKRRENKPKSTIEYKFVYGHPS